MKALRYVVLAVALIGIGWSLRGLEDFSRLRKAGQNFDQLYASYQTLDVAFEGMKQANQQCIAGWNGLINDVHQGTALINKKIAALKAAQ